MSIVPGRVGSGVTVAFDDNVTLSDGKDVMRKRKSRIIPIVLGLLLTASVAAAIGFVLWGFPVATSGATEPLPATEQETAYRQSLDTLDERIRKDEEYAAQGYGTGRESLEEGFVLRLDDSDHLTQIGPFLYADNEIYITGEEGTSYDEMALVLSRYGFSVTGYLPDDMTFRANSPESRDFLGLWAICKSMEREAQVRSALPSVSM